MADTFLNERQAQKLFQELLQHLASVFSCSRHVTYLSTVEKSLLLDDDEPSDSRPVFKQKLLGYPEGPLIHQIASYFVLLMTTGLVMSYLSSSYVFRHCPIEHTPPLITFDEKNYHDQRIATVKLVQEQLQGALTLWDRWTVQQKIQMLAEVFRRLRRRGLLDLLQLRRTVGTVDRLPIPRHLLVRACEELYDPSSSLTVCGRALTKHTVRDSTRWWGPATGSDEDKNKNGIRKVKEILDNAVWINIHQLPGAVANLEIRTGDGYGVRFDYDPLRFRGFVEPHQAEGWLNRYKH
ncbi:uncharacterized protein DEA37_0007509 [Paragonimus westermani]|uniref:Uncharacterized protein n=1 Tax=Paragonimus westermani TaxID=34504 RepID=A0A5J4NX25_9TREM|nr:uncharacterized protein DEA37_0007509 [Paragonimus westermani]